MSQPPIHDASDLDLPTPPTFAGFWSGLKALGYYLWPHDTATRLRCAGAICSLMIAKILAIWTPWLFRDLINHLSEPTAFILGILCLYGIARLASAVFGEIKELLFARVESRAIREAGIQVFRHLHQLSLQFHLDRKTGGLARVVERGTDGIERALRFLAFSIVPTLLEIIMVCGFLFWIYPYMYGLFMSITMVTYTVFTLLVTEWRTKYVRAMNEADNIGQTKAIDSLLNFETVKYFGNEAYEAQRFDAALTDFEHASVIMKRSLAFLNMGQNMIITTGVLLMTGVGAFDVIQGTLRIGDLILLNIYLMQLYLPISNLGFAYRETRRSLVNMEDMLTLLRIAPQVPDQPQAPALVWKRGEIVFDRVSFSYDGKRSILSNVSFSIAPGQKVALVGPSGSGKSTIARLLFRFFDPTEGRILIDGQDIRTVTQESLRRHMAVVPQDTVLFNDTLLYNISYGNPDALPQDIQTVLKRAALSDFVAKLPDGMFTVVGERGLKLSGGEKQRVSIARALLKNPDLFIFDEATSALDTQTEQEIQRHLHAISTGHSALMIAHRLSTIKDADTIIVLSHGMVHESGTHTHLIDINGLYARLWKKQSQHSERDVAFIKN